MRLAVIGGGPGGYVAALKAAQLGAQVTVIEQSEVGGTCLNRGCIPTKALLASAETFHRARNLSEYGIELNGTVSPVLSLMVERKNRIVSMQVKGIRNLFKSWGVQLIEGRGVLHGPGAVEVTKNDGTKTMVEAEKIIIATGSRPAEMALVPFDGERILSSDDVLNLRDIPKSMLIVGGGVIGCEFACLFGDLGTDVTVVEVQARAVSTEDGEISELLERELKKQKIHVMTGVSVTGVERLPDGPRVSLSNGTTVVPEKVLVSVGRALNSEQIGLEAVGIKRGPRGEITVNERMETTREGVYAVGDVTGGILLAHVASREGMVAASNACGGSAVIDYSVVPSVIFTTPEIASVGLGEDQARQRGIDVSIGRFPFRAIGRAHTMGEVAGFIKIITDAATDRVVGAHIIGPHASDLIHEIAVSMRAGLRSREIADTIHAHPTLSEGIMGASEAVHGEAIHMLKP